MWSKGKGRAFKVERIVTIKTTDHVQEPLEWQVGECVGTQSVRGDMKGGKAKQAGRGLSYRQTSLDFIFLAIKKSLKNFEENFALERLPRLRNDDRLGLESWGIGVSCLRGRKSRKIGWGWILDM